MQEEGGRPAERGRPPHLPLQFKIRGLFCRRVRRNEGIPPYGRPGGCGCPVWPVVFGRFVGEGHGPPGGLAAARGPRDDASIVPYRGLRYRRGCGSPVGRGPCRFVGADSISARGCLRRRVFPVGLYVFPRPVGRAFTPAAPWRFQKSGPCAAAEPGGMRASRPTDARVVAAVRFGRRSTVGRRGGIYPSRGHLRQRGVPGTMRASSPTEVCGLRRRAFKSWLAHLLKNAPALVTGPFIKKCPRFSGGIFIGGPARDHATHALKNSPPDCFLRLAPPGFQVLAGPFIKKCPRFSGGNLIGGPARDHATHALKNSPPDCFFAAYAAGLSSPGWPVYLKMPPL